MEVIVVLDPGVSQGTNPVVAVLQAEEDKLIVSEYLKKGYWITLHVLGLHEGIEV